jgi:pyridine nucleotide-disulfide oxidoreductase
LLEERDMVTRNLDAVVIGDGPGRYLAAICLAQPGKMIGGSEASDLIAEEALALVMGAYIEDVALTVHAHSTLPEAFMEACKAALGGSRALSQAATTTRRGRRASRGRCGLERAAMVDGPRVPHPCRCDEASLA